jgi:DNA-binding NtrC family response regulator
LKARVAERQFREDLYFRLSVFPVEIPPLRDRPGDVAILARFFVDRFSRDVNKPSLTLAPAAVAALESYSWPGNVRELQNCIERAVILTEGDTIQPRHLNMSARLSTAEPVSSDPWDQIDISGSLSDALRRLTSEVERRKIDRAIRDTGGNKVQAADALQVGLKVLVAKMRQYAIPD